MVLALAASLAFLSQHVYAQDNVVTQTNQGNASIRIAVADFKPTAADSQTTACKQTFDATLYADLATAGIFDIISKSLMPSGSPGSPAEMQVQNYANAPASAAFVAFGSIAVASGKLVVSGYLYDAKNLQYPQVFSRQYSEDPTDDSARQIAHQFADEIILRLGGGIPGIAETKIYYVKILSRDVKEIWMMDYDGANQHAITHLGTIIYSPRVSPDNSRLAFAALGKYGFQLKMYSLLLGRYVNFPSGATSSESPAWSPDGNKLAYAAAPEGSFNIWITDSNGNLGHRVTNFHGDTSPTFNPKTGDQIAFISGRTGLPQLYIMNTDGSGVQQMTDGGYASSPSWSPNGQFIAFAWDRKYGPGAPGGQDIYIMEIATKKWWQMTHDSGRCDFPTWSPDGRHIAYANGPEGRTRIWTILADPNNPQKRPLTGPGADMPNWSWK
ncbi:MAG: translocation protein TolB [Acidobacteriaceae bacterium]